MCAMISDVEPAALRYEIEPRSPELGGGWRLRLIEEDDEVGGDVFPSPANECSIREAYDDALAEGESWLASRLESSSS
jgi:hypothetical protein